MRMLRVNKGLGFNTSLYPVRRLLKAFIRHLPWEALNKDGVLCAGGDIRVKSSRWIYEALDSYDRKRDRLCRMSKVITILALIEYKTKIYQGLICVVLGQLLGSCYHAYPAIHAQQALLV